MKKRYTEEQIIKILKEHEGEKELLISSVSMASPSRHSTDGKVNSAVWMSARPNGSDNWKKKTEDSKRWSPTSLSTIRF